MFLTDTCSALWLHIANNLDSQSDQPSHVDAEKSRPNPQNILLNWHTVDRPNGLSSYSAWDCRCQIDDKYNPTSYFLVFRLGIDSFGALPQFKCSWPLRILLRDGSLNGGMEKGPIASGLHVCYCFAWREVFVSRLWQAADRLTIHVPQQASVSTQEVEPNRKAERAVCYLVLHRGSLKIMTGLSSPLRGPTELRAARSLARDKLRRAKNLISLH